jgi:hypothetical protein
MIDRNRIPRSPIVHALHGRAVARRLHAQRAKDVGFAHPPVASRQALEDGPHGLCDPFTSIVEQTASIFREILGDNVVLEHHSSI